MLLVTWSLKFSMISFVWFRSAYWEAWIPSMTVLKCVMQQCSSEALYFPPHLMQTRLLFVHSVSKCFLRSRLSTLTFLQAAQVTISLGQVLRWAASCIASNGGQPQSFGQSMSLYLHSLKMWLLKSLYEIDLILQPSNGQAKVARSNIACSTGCNLSTVFTDSWQFLHVYCLGLLWHTPQISLWHLRQSPASIAIKPQLAQHAAVANIGSGPLYSALRRPW